MTVGTMCVSVIPTCPGSLCVSDHLLLEVALRSRNLSEGVSQAGQQGLGQLVVVGRSRAGVADAVRRPQRREGGGLLHRV